MMRPFYWLKLLGFFFILALSGRVFRILDFGPQTDVSCRDSLKTTQTSPHPFLCGEKKKIESALVSDLAVVEGISIRKARDLKKYFQDHPESPIENAEKVRGIGPKLFLRLRERFY